jgi:Protein of unknown function (DUF2911)
MRMKFLYLTPMERKKFLILQCLILTIALSARAQPQETSEPMRPSPLAIASLRYKDAYVKITYSRPMKRGREIFGKVVPYGKVWRTGANEATEITTTKNITLNGFLLKAGTYSLFTVPDKDKWTIVVNSELGLWGSYNHNPKLDVLRFDVPVQTADRVYEAFTIELESRNESADLKLLWDKVKVLVPVKFLN